MNYSVSHISGKKALHELNTLLLLINSFYPNFQINQYSYNYKLCMKSVSVFNFSYSNSVSLLITWSFFCFTIGFVGFYFFLRKHIRRRHWKFIKRILFYRFGALFMAFMIINSMIILFAGLASVQAVPSLICDFSVSLYFLICVGVVHGRR